MSEAKTYICYLLTLEKVEMMREKNALIFTLTNPKHMNSSTLIIIKIIMVNSVITDSTKFPPKKTRIKQIKNQGAVMLFFQTAIKIIPSHNIYILSGIKEPSETS